MGLEEGMRPRRAVWLKQNWGVNGGGSKERDMSSICCLSSWLFFWGFGVERCGLCSAGAGWRDQNNHAVVDGCDL